MIARAVAAVLVRLARIALGVSGTFETELAPGVARVYVANHTSHLDGVVVWAALPPEERARARPVAAGDYWQATAFRRTIARDVFRSVFVDRAHVDRETVPRLAAVLDGGGALVLFPEGTRGDGTAVGPFRAGLFHLVSHRPDTEIVPVRLENLARSLPKGKTLPVPMLGRATFGAPFRLAPDESKDAFLARARDAVARLGAPA
ncbi:lysophospholipid acyltransferase family protein [Rubrivirga sp. IMCC45206]|uniref:lysophospholipid acyltransferase family protein n=1 Tax=Rubrivirga sp. IMCC45206 TaxID=3391614 RepID=UPI00399032EE